MPFVQAKCPIHLAEQMDNLYEERNLKNGSF